MNVDSDLFPIRAVAEATGVSTATLRMWERRYGRPVPVRLPSGHRRYTSDQVAWLRRVAEALARGHRPAAVVRADEAHLAGLLGGEGGGEPALTPEIARLLEYVAGFDQAAIVRVLDQETRDRPPLEFIEDMAVPLMVAVGRAWADGRLEVRHEHFLSNLIDDALRNLRTRLVVGQRGAPAVLTTLPGEPHGLGLQMAAVVCELNGVPVTYLGIETPIDDIVAAAVETSAFAVVLAVSMSTAGVENDQALAALMKALPPDVRLVVGGAFARRGRRGPRGIDYVPDFASLERWLTDARARGVTP